MLVAAVAAAVDVVVVVVAVVVVVFVFLFLLVLLLIPLLGRWAVLRVDHAATFARRSLFLHH